jgi:hypothetical protein
MRVFPFLAQMIWDTVRLSRWSGYATNLNETSFSLNPNGPLTKALTQSDCFSWTAEHSAEEASKAPRENPVTSIERSLDISHKKKREPRNCWKTSGTTMVASPLQHLHLWKSKNNFHTVSMQEESLTEWEVTMYPKGTYAKPTLLQ